MPKSAKSFRPHLTLGDVAITSHGPLVTLQFTEAIQFGGRHLHIPLLAVIPCLSLFTPLRMIRLVPARRSCPVFLISGHKDLVDAASPPSLPPSIHVQYTRIESSRLRALTTRLTGSLVASGSKSSRKRKRILCLPEVKLIDVGEYKMLTTRHDSIGSSRLVATLVDSTQ